MKRFAQTTNGKSALIARFLISLPLILIGSQHLLGLAPLEPILQGAGIPFPSVNALIGPVVQILAGLLLLGGYFARLGALLTIPAMSLAFYTHLVFDWADDPPVALPLVLIALSIYVLWKGAGA